MSGPQVLDWASSWGLDGGLGGWLDGGLVRIAHRFRGAFRSRLPSAAVTKHMSKEIRRILEYVVGIVDKNNHSDKLMSVRPGLKVDLVGQGWL